MKKLIVMVCVLLFAVSLVYAETTNIAASASDTKAQIEQLKQAIKADIADIQTIKIDATKAKADKRAAIIEKTNDIKAKKDAIKALKLARRNAVKTGK